MTDWFDDALAARATGRSAQPGTKPLPLPGDWLDDALAANPVPTHAKVIGRPDTAATLVRGVALFGRDDEAERQRLALDLKQYLGEDLPSGLVDPQADRKRLKAQEMDHAIRASTSLQDWVLAHPENVKGLSPDSANRLVAAGEAIKGAAQGFYGNPANFLGGLAGTPARIASYAQTLAALPLDVDAALSHAVGYDRLSQALGISRADGTSAIGQYLRGNADEAARMAEDLSTIGGKPTGNVGIGVSAAGSSLGQSGVALGAGWLARSNPVALGIMGAMTLADSYRRGMKETGGQVGRSLLYGLADATAEVVTEAPGVGALFKIPGLKQGAKEVLKQVGNFALKEGIGEQFATAWQDLNDWAFLHPEKTLQQYLAERPDAAAQTAVATLLSGGGQVALMRYLGKRGRDESRALFDALNQAGQGADLREKLPEKWRDYVARATRDGPVENVFIPADRFTTYFQDAGHDPVQVAQDLNATNYADAVALGGDVVVPMADFATRIAGTNHYAGLADDLRLHQGEMTAREAALEDANREEYDRKAEESIRQMIAEGEKAQGTNAAIDRIVGDVEGQLIGAGVEPGTARTQANLMRGVAVWAQRAIPGQDAVKTAEQLWARYGLTVRRDLPAVLTQLKNVDMDLDPLLDMLRGSGGPTDQMAFGVSLSNFLRAQGGLAPVQDIADTDPDVNLRPFQKRLLREGGMTLDRAAELAVKEGYFPGRDIASVTEADIIDAINEDVRTGTVYSAAQMDERQMNLQATLSDLWRAVQDAGVDLNQTGNQDVRRLLEQSGPVAGAYLQTAWHGSPHDNAWLESQIASNTMWRTPREKIVRLAEEYRAALEKAALGKGRKADKARLTLARNDYAKLVDSAHKNRTLTFQPLPAEAFKGGILLHQSPSYGKKAGSSYRLLLVNGEPAYARESDHWGRFWTSNWINGEQVSSDFDWQLEGVSQTELGGKQRRAGYVLLRDLEAAPANSRELGSQAPELSGMQERPAVRADDSGSLEEPAQSGVAGGGAENAAPDVRFSQGEYAEPDAATLAREYAEVEARYKGTGQWMKAPDGTPTLLNERQWVQVRTPRFKEWFGDWENDPANASKVVSPNGEPMVVYHGTNNDFDIFDFEKIASTSGDHGYAGTGVYFSPNKRFASGHGKNLLQVFLRFKSPLKLDELSTGEKYELAAYLQDNAPPDAPVIDLEALRREDGKITIDDFDYAGIHHGKLEAYAEQLTSYAAQNGYDGINLGDVELVALQPTQIKSATGNSGAYDGTNPNILFQARAVSGAVGQTLQAMLDADAVVVDTTALAGKHGRELRDAAKDLYPKDETETNAKSKETVRFVMRGFREMKYHSGDERVMLIVPSLHQLLRDATPLWTNVDDGTHPGVRLWHNYGVRATIDGEDVIVRLAAREMDNGEIDLLHYDSDVRPIAEVKKAMAGRLFDPNQNRPPATDADAATSRDSVVQWLNGVNLADAASQHYKVFRPRQLAQQTELNDAPYINPGKTRGYLQIGADRRMTLGLTKNADLSTFLHETGHFYLEMLGDVAEMDGVSQEVKDDYAAILKWLGVASRGEIQTEHHEKFARANEAYLMEGKAPAPELQGAFARFREWLKLIYSKISLNVALSDEVRGVFDRIYATDAEIAAARAETPGPMPRPPGMTQAEYDAYLEAEQRAVTAGREALQTRLMRQKLRARQEWWRTERQLVLGEVTAEVDSQPVYAAWNDLMGEGGKLSAAALIRRYGEDFIKTLPRGFGRIYTHDGGTDPEVAAQRYGFDSADALIKAIAEMRNRRELIEAETDARMRERYGDLMTDGTIAEAATDALHNDHAAEVLAIELKALGNRESLAALKRAVAATLGRMKALDIRPAVYLAAERRAAREAFDAATRQDYTTARDAKRREMLNHLLYRGATAAREEMAGIEKHWKTLAHDNKARAKIGKAGQEWLAQMDAILERFSFIPFARLQRARGLAEWLADMAEKQADDAGAPEMPAVSPLVLREAGKTHWKELTLDELRAVDDTLASIEHVARKINEVILNGKSYEMAEIVARVKETVAASKLRDWKEVRPGDEPSVADRIHAVTDTLYRPEKLMELLDGGTKGLFHDLLWNKAADAQVLADDLKAQVLTPLEGIVTGMDATHEARMAERIHLRGIGRSISRYEIIGVLLNTGNESNLTKMQKGGIVIHPGEPAIPISDAALEEMKATLNADERDMIQTIWDTIGQLYPHLNDLNIRTVGLPLKKVESHAVPMPGAEPLRGGYWPAVADPRYSRIGEKQEQGQAVSAADFFPAPYANAATRHSFREERTGAVYPMNFDWKTILSRHVNKAVVDIAYHEFVKEANRILRNTEVKAALTAKLGTDQTQGLREWLAFQVEATTAGMLGARPADRLTSLLTGNAIVAALGFKVGVALGNTVVAPFQAMHQVKGQHLMAGIAEFMAHPQAARDKVRTLSGEMRHRQNHLDATWTEVMERLAGKPTLRKAVMHTAMQIHMLADIIGTTGVWLGKYNQAMSEGADSRTAVLAADKTIRTSQTAGAAKDLSAWERDPKNSWWKMFLGPMLIMQNEARGAFVLKHKRVMTLFATWIIPAILFDLAAGRGPDDDEEPEEWALRKLLVYPFLTMPHIREIASVIEASVSGKPSNVRGMPLTEAGLSAWRAGKKLWSDQADEGDKVQAAIQITGLTGMPSGAAGTASNYLVDLMTGETEFESPADLRWLFIRRPDDVKD